jgi:predicted hotdog family 3-hydroxylacyl-ACP dehydratase
LEIARIEIREAVLTAFCRALHDTRLPPLALIELAAQAVGSVYREVADAHCGDPSCPCGWRPRLAADLEALQAALALSAAPASQPDLAGMAVLGRA